MTLKLLRTKLYIPPMRLDCVRRSRLVNMLESGKGHKLTLISAPAGFGKTTLLSEWIHQYQQTRRVCWVSLDERDNQQPVFWAYVVAAIQTIHEAFGEDILSALRSPQPPPVTPLVYDLINEINESCDPFSLVLDDYQVIESPEVNATVAEFVEYLPSQVNLVIASRTDPSWSVSHLRASGELVELRASDLRFTPEEVTDFLNEVMKLALTEEDIEILDSRTEGWIAGLQLAAISLKGRDTRSFIQAFSGSHRYILDYLVEEVLDHQPAEVRSFLLGTSILERLCAGLCDVVLDRDNSQDLLVELDTENLFIIPLDDIRHWYRYHHLFGELLRSQLSFQQPELARLYHQRASDWYDEQGYIEDSINHAFAAEDFERAARLVEKYARDMLHQSKYSLLSSWIEALPDELVTTRAWLCVYQSWTRHWAGLREEGERYLEVAERLADEHQTAGPEDNSSGEAETLSMQDAELLPGYIATVRAHYAVINEEVKRAVEQSQYALKILPKDDFFTRGTAGVALGAAYWAMGDVRGAEDAFAECASNALAGGFNYRASSALVYLGIQQVKQARLRAAEQTYKRALSLSEGAGGKRYPNAGYPLSKLAELSCEWNQLDEAHSYAVSGVELCQQLGHVDLIAEAYAALARVQLARREFIELENTLISADKIRNETKLDPWIGVWLDECWLQSWFLRGKFAEVQRWVRSSDLLVDGEFSFHHDLEHLNLARVLVAQVVQNQPGSDADIAFKLLERLYEAAEKAGWTNHVIQVLILKGQLRYLLGERADGLADLSTALRLAEPGGYIRIFVDHGSLMEDMLRSVPAAGETANYRQNLLSAFKKTGQIKPGSQLIEPLTRRELEVLRLLNTHLSTPEIAQELYISVNTVRSHIKNIYGKLNVNRRIAAVQRAEELGLLARKNI